MVRFPNPMRPMLRSKEERVAARLRAASFEADLQPDTLAPRLRFNFRNGWTASLALREGKDRCNFLIASVAAWPTGREGKGLTELGPTEASADEAMNWLDDIRCREPIL